MENLLQKLWISILVVLFVLTSFCLAEIDNSTTSNLELKDNLIEEIREEVLSNDMVNSFDLNKLFEILVDYQTALAETSRDYLAIAVTIILGSGIIFYLVNMRPFQDKMEKQEEQLKKQSEYIKETETRIKNLMVKLKALEGSTQKSLQKMRNILQGFEKEAVEQKEMLRKSEYSNLTAESNISRTLGILSKRDKIHHKSFYWWLRAAYYFNKIDEKDLIKIAIDNVKSQLEKISQIETGKPREEIIKKLLNDDKDVKIFINALRNNYKRDIDAIEQLRNKLLEEVKPK